jgi:hypothetical protein
MDHTQSQACIDACQACHNACLDTATVYCLEQGWPHAERRHVRLLLDCAAMCDISAGFLLRGSPLHDRTCALCADLCRLCADDCERFNDGRMDDCAHACRDCAEVCLEMASASVG